MTTPTDLSPEIEAQIRRVLIKVDLACRRRYGDDNQDEAYRRALPPPKDKGRPTPLMARIRAELEKDPSAQTREIAERANCSVKQASYWRSRWDMGIGPGPRQGSSVTQGKIRNALARNPNASNREIADEVGCSRNWVGEYRRKLERDGE